MNATLADFSADSRDRLWKLLESNNISYRDRLKESADSAGEQLEWLKPSVMGGHGNELYAGPAVMDSPGTVLILLAHEKKAFTMHLLARPTHSLADAVKNAVENVKELPEFKADELSAGVVVSAIADLIEKYGAAPGKRGAELSQEHNFRIIGCLFASIPETMRSDIVDRLEKIAATGVCPVLIGRLGKGTETGLCAAWPLLFPLAPYVDTVT